MNIKFTITLAFCLCTATLFAQNSYSVQGVAIDTTSFAKLSYTTVSILNSSDSVLRKFTYAGESGSFSVTGLPAGKYILLMTYNKDYADYEEIFTLDAAHPVHDFGSINMRLKSKILQEVLIKGQIQAIKIKGDTTEYNAKAYVIQPNDKVEDLLKQLPGMQVDKDGNITAQGQTITKVLVDGEEFFGDDPKLVTQNIRADMVDKIQLYDKKSDQATFTGIDDGVKTKTINIKLKEDKKDGIFGKVSGGVGTQEYYEGQGIYNRFKPHEKYSAYFTVANDGKTGLGFLDATNTGTSNVQVSDEGGLFVTSNGDALDSFNGTYDGRGQPLARNGGVHYDGKWNSDKESINLNYKIGSLEITGSNSNISQQSLANNLINSNSNQTFDNYGFRQKADAAYTLKIDTSANLKITADATQKNFSVNNNYLTNSNRNDTLVNKENRTIANNGDQQLFNASALYTKKFSKPRRTFSWAISEAYNQNQTKGYEVSKTDFYNKLGVQDSVENVNQYKTTHTTSSVLNSNMTYTEPLSKTLSLIINYGLGINNSLSDNKSFDQSLPGVYNVLNTTFSNDYQFNQLINQLGAVFNYKYKKLLLNFGTKASNVDFKQVNENTGTVFHRSFIDWDPQASVQYQVAQRESFSFYYNGRPTQPTINQIQPVPVNTDPLNIVLGNPNLKASFTNNLSGLFRFNQAGQSFYLQGEFSNTSNTIVNSNITDPASGKTTTQYINLTGKTPYNYSIYTNYEPPINPVSIDVTLSTNGAVSYSYINNLLNQSKSYDYSASISLYKSKQSKYTFSAGGGPNYSINEFSLQQQSNNNAGGYNLRASALVFLPFKFQLSSNINYTYKAKTQAFGAENRTLLNAAINKAFLEGDHLKLSLSGNDLLNQNINFSRNISGNSITQATSTGLKRYLMFSISWDFTKFGTVAEKNN